MLSSERLTPHMIRLVVGGDDLAGFAPEAFSDSYVKVSFPPPGAGYQAPYDPEQLRQTLPKDQLPRVRSYTVRAWDPATRQLTLDFVYHGDVGVAGPWAAAAKPGDKLQMMGPGGAYTPDPSADWHLMIGDAAVLPAIAASLERIPAGTPVHVLAQVDSPDDRIELTSPGELHLTWTDDLAACLADLDFPAGRVHAFVHGEAELVRTVRRQLLVDRKLPREALSVSGYWKQGRDDEGWRADKREWNRQAEADTAQLA